MLRPGWSVGVMRVIWKSNLAEINARHLAKCMASWFFDVTWFMMLTTARLSHWARTVAPHHSDPPIWSQLS